jgi:hypothetical protein
MNMQCNRASTCKLSTACQLEVNWYHSRLQGCEPREGTYLLGLLTQPARVLNVRVPIVGKRSLLAKAAPLLRNQ